MVCGNAGILGGDTKVSSVGVFYICGDCGRVYDFFFDKSEAEKKKYGRIKA